MPRGDASAGRVAGRSAFGVLSHTLTPFAQFAQFAKLGGGALQPTPRSGSVGGAAAGKEHPVAQSLATRSCVPCRGGTPPLTHEQIEPLLGQVEGWTVEEDKKLVKSYRFRDFAEAEGHHPDLHLSWGRVGAEIWTHKIGGLTESDFILAAKLDRAREAMDCRDGLGVGARRARLGTTRRGRRSRRPFYGWLTGGRPGTRTRDLTDVNRAL